MTKKLHQLLQFQNLNFLGLMVSILTMVTVLHISMTLLSLNTSTLMINATSQFYFFPLLYYVTVLLDILFIICSVKKFMLDRHHLLYLLQGLLGLMILILFIYGFDILRVTTYMIMGHTNAVEVMFKGMKEVTLLKHFTTMTFAYVMSGYVSILLFVYTLITRLQSRYILTIPHAWRKVS